MPTYKDIPYIADDNPRHTLDIYVPDTATASLPLVIFIHGGSWRTGDKSECQVLAQGLASQGPAIAVINYGLSQHTPDSIRHPAHLQDAIKAVQFLVHNRDYPARHLVDTNNVYLVGHSAGAHLASLMVLSNELDCIASVRGVLGVGGIYDIPGLLELYPDYSDFIDMAFDPTQYREASPQHVAKCKCTDAEHIRFLIINSAGDSLIASTLSASFASQLISSGYTNVELVVRDLGSHFGMLDNKEFWLLATNFVRGLMN
ncbi:hypothetical protein IWW57_002295 [Coemansia sp. S610]|uniref:Uncharacterized protein n=1 Tax=Coemansia linderi TaxID=2663919 RepID=A0ACC1K9W8_9FUNG|nr:hypothetical protein IWW57_002295 [Coemansia sp. S610]KAJ2699048.1 hypothetical protein H4218_002900 [Coemansia sp. IMI 209128]KAJ2777390.1 hypothetical protein GGI18_004204 [Coemansia linderi]